MTTSTPPAETMSPPVPRPERARLGTLTPSLDEVRRIASLPDAPRTIPLAVTRMADMETPVSAYLKLAGDGEGFILESIEGGTRLARYSFIGGRPAARLVLDRGTMTITRDGGETTTVTYEDPLIALEGVLDEFRAAERAGGPRFCGGLVGYLSYEAVRAFEPRVGLPQGVGLDLPDGNYLLADDLIVFDNVDRTVRVLAQIHLGDGPVDEAYAAAAAKLDETLARLDAPTPALPRGGAGVETPVADRMQANITAERYREMVETAKEYIAAGDIIQVVLSQRVDIATPVHPLTIYRALRSVNPAPYLFYVNFGDHQVVGASPELLVRLEDGMITNHPIAGTRPRGATPDEDEALAVSLAEDEKERAEHIMLVDLGRNDVGRVAAPGTVRVPKLMEIERYSQVMHLVSHVEGELSPGLSGLDALRSCFPAGTVSGAPKVRAMEIIAEQEADRRGPYAGALGYFDFAGGMDTAITLRTLVFRDGVASLQAGGGIVADSTPEYEYAETFHKMRALQRAIELAETLESSDRAV
ncbi:MAG TPA: anthranilate synthase component I [Thermomicrobiales bacterium]|jgi:anthranilate synthase component 1|nr:anthranilate synthase component I [Thermomicrobiales bacterium]